MNVLSHEYVITIQEVGTDWEYTMSAESNSERAQPENRVRAAAFEFIAERLRADACLLRKRLDA